MKGRGNRALSRLRDPDGPIYAEPGGIESVTLIEQVYALPKDADLREACVVIAADMYDGKSDPDELLLAVMGAISVRFFK